MAFFRSYIAPLLIVLTFLIAMLAVSARIFLPNDMMAPAPVDDPVGLVTPPGSSLKSVSNDVALEVAWFLQGTHDAIG